VNETSQTQEPQPPQPTEKHYRQCGMKQKKTCTCQKLDVNQWEIIKGEEVDNNMKKAAPIQVPKNKKKATTRITPVVFPCYDFNSQPDKKRVPKLHWQADIERCRMYCVRPGNAPYVATVNSYIIV
jgi:hypothetical protein